mgnify:CR=1 FL=1
MNTGVFADTQSWHNPPYPELYRECKRKKDGSGYPKRPNQIERHGKRYYLERFFIYRQGNIDTNY